MRAIYQRVSQSMVAQHPNPIGVIEFYGGQFFGQLPTTSYDYFLQSLFDARYTIIAVPFQLGFDHGRIAEMLLDEREAVRAWLPALTKLPLFWVGHSLGCKFIALLEAYTDRTTGMFVPPGVEVANTVKRGILDEPSLLIAPDISDTRDVVQLPILPDILDKLGLGVRPTKAETQRLIAEDDLFGLTALISFTNDTIAGNQKGPIEESDVAWFLQTLRDRNPAGLLHKELEGEHLEPVGIRIKDTIYVPSLTRIVTTDPVPRPLEQVAVEFLAELAKRRERVTVLV